MAKLFTVTVQVASTKQLNVVAETADEAKAKVPAVEGETVVNVEEKGDVVA